MKYTVTESQWSRKTRGHQGAIKKDSFAFLMFYRFPESQWRSLCTTNAIERMPPEFRRRFKTQAALPNEGAVLRLFFGLWISGQMKHTSTPQT